MVHKNILCFITYCNSVYGKLSEKKIHKLQKTQNNSVRFVFGLHGKKRKEPILPFLKKLHFLAAKYRIQFKICLVAFRRVNNTAPNYLFTLRESRRRSSRLDYGFILFKVLQRPSFSRFEGAFYYIGPKL